jgi:hypothetical protein
VNWYATLQWSKQYGFPAKHFSPQNLKLSESGSPMGHLHWSERSDINCAECRITRSVFFLDLSVSLGEAFFGAGALPAGFFGFFLASAFLGSAFHPSRLIFPTIAFFENPSFFPISAMGSPLSKSFFILATSPAGHELVVAI